MRRGVETSPESGFHKDLRSHVRHRSFPVCAGYMYTSETPVGMPQVIVKGKRVTKIISVCSFAYPVISRELTEEKIQCLLVIHKLSISLFNGLSGIRAREQQYPEPEHKLTYFQHMQQNIP